MLPTLDRHSWNRPTAAHLLGRAGFGGTPAEVSALETLGVGAAVESLLTFIPENEVEPPAWVEPGVELRARADRRLEGFDTMTPAEQTTYSQSRIARDRQRTRDTAAWWIERMRAARAPLHEKLTLFWHGHFATQDSTVRSGYSMYRQNRTLRAYARSGFADLLLQVCRDPAMLRYLDNDTNRRGAPNENFARELLELFTLGEGQYGEKNVSEVARAFTGWGIDQERMEFRFFASRHDDESKEILGEVGRLGGEDVVRILASHPEVRRLLARKLWTYFAYEDPEPEIVEALATELANGDDLRPVLRALFTSAAFYSERAIRTRIKGPVEWLVELLRSLGGPSADPGWTLEALAELGQLPFEPPNVAGWPGGRRWITAATLLTRYRKTAELMLHPAFAIRLDADEVLPLGARQSRESACASLLDRLFPTGLATPVREELCGLLDALPEPAAWSDVDVREAIARLTATPYYQVG